MKVSFKIKYMLIFIVYILFAFSNNIYAAGSFSVSLSKTSLNPGNTATLTIKTVNCAGKFSISSSNTAVLTVSNSSAWVDGTMTLTITAKASGTASITVKPIDVTDNELNDITGSKSVTIKVSAPTSSSQPTTKPSSNTSTSSKPSSGTSKSATSGAGTVSNNAFLKEFRVDSPGISPAFSKTIYNYAITVGENVDRLSVTAIPENSKATVNISGNTNLKVGDNLVTVRVTAQDKKTVKTYKIIITKTDDPIKSNAYLQNLIIKGQELSPTFSSEVLDYSSANISSDIDKLDIVAFPVNEKAKVTIEGNDKLVTGENTIKVIVTSENSKTQKIYTIKVNKEESKLIGDANEGAQPQNKVTEASSFKDTLSVMKEILKEKAAVLLLYAFVWIEFLQVVYLYEKLQSRNNITIK